MTAKSREWLAPGCAVLLALALRAWVADHEMLFDDGPRFLGAAQHFLEGNFSAALSDAFHPLTAAVIAAVTWLTGIEPERAGVLISILSGGVATAALYALARDAFDARIALVCALIFAAYPRSVAAGSNVQSDGLYLALFLSAAYVAWRTLRVGGIGRAFLAGTLCGLAYLTRPEGLAVAVVLAFWLGAERLAGTIPWRRVLEVGVGFAAAALLFGGPYLLLINLSGSELVLTQKKNLLPAAFALPSASRLLAALREVPIDITRGYELLWIYLLFAVRRGRPSRATLYLVSYAGLFFVLLIVVHLAAGYVSRRHWLSAACLLMPFMAMGVLRVAGVVATWLPLAEERRRWVPVAWVGVLIALFMANEVTRSPEPVKIASKEAALWLRSYDVSSIAAHRSRVAYYAGAERIVELIRTTDAQALLEHVHAQGAEYLISERSRLPPLPAGGLKGLREVHRVPYEGGEVLVLRVEGLPSVAAPP